MEQILNNFMNFLCRIKNNIIDLVSIPLLPIHNNCSKYELGIMNDKLSQVLKREKSIIHSIDYLQVEVASSGYVSNADMIAFDFKYTKDHIEALFNQLRALKNIISENYYSINFDEIVEIPLNLRLMLWNNQRWLNNQMEYLSEIKEYGKVSTDKLRITE